VDVSDFPKQKCRQKPYYNKVMRNWDRDHAKFIAGDPAALGPTCVLICGAARGGEQPKHQESVSVLHLFLASTL
jgi:hypothetical protein